MKHKLFYKKVKKEQEKPNLTKYEKIKHNNIFYFFLNFTLELQYITYFVVFLLNNIEYWID